VDREFVLKNNIIDRYVRGELDPVLEAEFEKFYLQDSVTLEQLDSLILPGPLESAYTKVRSPIYSISVMIALFALGIAVGVVISSWLDAQQLGLGKDTMVIELNSDEADYQLNLSTEDPKRRLVLKVPVVDRKAVTLVLQSAYLKHRFEHLTVNPDGYVMFDLPLNRLSSGLWWIESEPSGLEHNYRLQLRLY